ncbi:hypothetical protein D3C85_1132400 [compost metagenome]
MLGVDLYALRCQLALQALGRHGVTEEQVQRVFIIDKMAVRVGLGLLAPLLHRHAVVGAVLTHLDTAGAQAILLPLAGIGGHVHRGLEAQARTDDADRQAQVAGGADRHTVLAKKGPGLIAVELGVAIARLQQATGQGQVFGVLEHFIDAAAGLDRTGNWQQVVGLEPQGTGWRQLLFGTEHRLQGMQRQQRRFDDAGNGCGLGEGRGDERGKAFEPGAGLVNIFSAQRHITQGFGARRQGRVEPAGRAQRHQFSDQRMSLAPDVHRLLQRHCHAPSASG